jgi:hypothetical protein
MDARLACPLSLFFSLSLTFVDDNNNFRLWSSARLALEQLSLLFVSDLVRLFVVHLHQCAKSGPVLERNVRSWLGR